MTSKDIYPTERQKKLAEFVQLSLNELARTNEPKLRKFLSCIPPSPRRYIAGPAMLVGGETYCLAPPNRHHQLIRLLVCQFNIPVIGAYQGFVDGNGVYLSREDAWLVARSAGQINCIAGERSGSLTSEDLW